MNDDRRKSGVNIGAASRTATQRVVIVLPLRPAAEREEGKRGPLVSDFGTRNEQDKGGGKGTATGGPKKTTATLSDEHYGWA